LVPIVGYLIVDYASRDVVQVPRFYIPESVDTVTVDGKVQYDTVFHKVKNVELVNHLGDTVTFDQLKGKIIVANFFFTSCPTICPTLIKNMKLIQESFSPNDTLIQLVSFTVDPERDSVAKLKAYADKNQIDPFNYWFLTGEKKEIYDIARHEFYVTAVEGDGGPDDFIHSEKIIVLDKDRHIRGFYNGLETEDVHRLINDIAIIHIAKDKKKPGLIKRLFSK
jgi:protein SCO1/2